MKQNLMIIAVCIISVAISISAMAESATNEPQHIEHIGLAREHMVSKTTTPAQVKAANKMKPAWSVPTETVETPLPELYVEPPPDIESRYPPITDEERGLLARLVWLEARGEPPEGQQAVAEVVLNRVISDSFDHVNTVEEVIFDKRHAVQFTVAHKIDTATPTELQYTAVDTAMYGSHVLDADYLFFARKALTDKEIIKIGNHYFSK